MISHRLKTVQSCDLILVLDQGKIVESGSHDELIHKVGGTYANLVKKQSLLHGSSHNGTNNNTNKAT
jgi:ABC-type multidrug transport system fused ATPase/permease subunit